MKLQVFDMAYNSGVKQAVRTLQKAVGEVPDGILGPRTLQAVQSMPVLRLVARFNGARLEFMADLPTWSSFSRGWCKRIALNLQEA
jgi:lysozyme family protein